MLSWHFHFARPARAVDVAPFQLQVQLDTQAPVLGILGASGAGKSTLLNLVAGLLSPQAGVIRLNQQVFFDSHHHINMPSHKRHIGIMFQQPLLFPHLSVKQNLLYGWRYIKASQRRFALAQITELLEIDQLINRRTNQLSGGEAQRVALGRALLYSPQLLLLDEPLSALDIRLKQQILPFFMRIRDEIHIPMVYVTHHAQELHHLQADIVQMQAGRLILGS